MKRDEEFFLASRGYTFLCDYIRNKYPEHSYMIMFRDAANVLKECKKNVSN